MYEIPLVLHGKTCQLLFYSTLDYINYHVIDRRYHLGKQRFRLLFGHATLQSHSSVQLATVGVFGDQMDASVRLHHLIKPANMSNQHYLSESEQYPREENSILVYETMCLKN
jgi:hypothetical protein